MPAIRHQINIAAPIRSVWRAITTPDGLTSWWADQARIDARAGGRIVVTTEGGDGEPVEERGIVHEYRPTRKVEIAWDSSSPAPTKGTRLTFQLARDGDETRLSLIHSGAGILEDVAARETLEREWKSAFQALRTSLEAG